MTLAFAESQSYRNGIWLPLRDLAWSVTDLGTTQGAMLVERLRTFGGRLVDVDDHLARLADGAEKLGIPWPPKGVSMHELCEDLVRRNQDLSTQEGDFGLVLLLSPGDPGIDRKQSLTPTILGHVTPLPFVQLSRWYRSGVALHFASVRNVPDACWSPSIKTRSRLQYYLADREDFRSAQTPTHPPVENIYENAHPSESIAVLLNMNGYVTETSISNLLVLGQDGVLRSPPLKDILWGMSLRTVCQLAESIGQPVEFTNIHPNDMSEAREILMTGTTGCLWAATSVADRPIGNGTPGTLCSRLQAAWHQKLGVNFIEQATQRGS